MSIVLSCGCKFDDWPDRYYSVAWESTTRENLPCVRTGTYCEPCTVDSLLCGEVLCIHALHRTPYDVVPI